jgi:hypothetical protein
MQLLLGGIFIIGGVTSIFSKFLFGPVKNIEDWIPLSLAFA